MNRFRPNVVVSGGKEWAEDKWLKIETRARKSKSGGDGGGGGERGGEEGGVSWDLVKPCSRCTIPDINQETGIFDKNREVSRALQKFRSGTVLNSQTKSWANEVFFGWNMITSAPESAVRLFKNIRRRRRDCERAQTKSQWWWFHVVLICIIRVRVLDL